MRELIAIAADCVVLLLFAAAFVSVVKDRRQARDDSNPNRSKEL